MSLIGDVPSWEVSCYDEWRTVRCYGFADAQLFAAFPHHCSEMALTGLRKKKNNGSFLALFTKSHWVIVSNCHVIFLMWFRLTHSCTLESTVSGNYLVESGDDTKDLMGNVPMFLRTEVTCWGVAWKWKQNISLYQHDCWKNGVWFQSCFFSMKLHVFQTFFHMKNSIIWNNHKNAGEKHCHLPVAISFYFSYVQFSFPFRNVELSWLIMTNHD